MARGQCGVGDYTRKLAAELIRQGHRTSVIAVRDFNVTDILEEWQEDRKVQVPVLRLPAPTGLNVKARRIQSFLEQQGAEWLSLQYVPFSFQKKGIHWTWNPFFEKIGKGKHWHIMFHELWLGLNKEASIKEVWWGEAQRQCLLNLVRKLKPACIHTHADVYGSALLQNNISVQQLPLFSNIDPDPDLIHTDQRPDVITFVVFASMYKSTKQDLFLEELEAENRRSSRSARFIFLGRNGALKKQWKQAIAQKQTLTFEDLGPMDARSVSFHLAKADIGLSFTPLSLAKKSGTVACYWAHGLPVLSLADHWRARKKMEMAYPAGMASYEPGRLQAFLNNYAAMEPTYKSSDEIADQFASQLAMTVNTANDKVNP